MTYQILIVDDEAYVLHWIEQLVRRINGFKLELSFASNGLMALEQMTGRPADLIILDISMPGINGIDTAKEIRRFWPETEILFLTGCDSFSYIYQANKLERAGYFLKLEEDELLISALTESLLRIQADRSRTHSLKLYDELIRQIEESHQLMALLNGTVIPDKESLPVYIMTAVFPNPADTDSEHISRLLAMISAADELKLDCHFTWESSGRYWCLVPAKSAHSPEDLMSLANRISPQGTPFCRFLSVPVSLAELPGIRRQMIACFQHKKTPQSPEVILPSHVQAPQISEQEAEPEQSNLNLRVMKEVEYYIRENISQPMSLSEIAAYVHYSPSYISRLFKYVRNENLFEYITNCRLEKAKELLSETNMKIFEIAQQVGISSANYFNILFRKHMGCTPQSWRLDHPPLRHTP